MPITPTADTAAVPAASPEGSGSAASVAPRKGAILAIILVAYFMILLDNSVIFTALPSLEKGLHLAPAELAWVQDAYTLVFGGFLLLGARAGDILGRKRVFVAGLVVFSIASLLVAVAPTGWWIISARTLQGIGAAIVAPTSLSLLTASFRGEERTKAIAWYSAMAGIGSSLGLVLGGALASWLSWRAGFFVNVPIGVAMIVLAPRFLPRTATVSGRFDVLGAIASTLGVGSAVFAVLHAAENGWTSAPTVISLIAAVVLLVFFVLHEARAAQPIMPLRLFRSRERVGGYLTRLLYLGAMIGFFYFTTQYLQGVLGYTPLQAGLAFLPMTAANFAVAAAVPALTRRIGNAPMLVAGVAITFAGLLWLSRIGVGSDYVTAVAAPMLLIGAGQGLAFAPMTAAGIAGASAEDAGAASGVLNTFHQMGTSLGLGVLVAVTALAAPGADAAATPSAQVSAAMTGASALVLGALAVVLALIVPAALAERRRSVSAAPNVPAPNPSAPNPIAPITGATTIMESSR
ncbi:MFS transporter [Planctomonas sp. JC2975]|uniref:MFS transporter n=1 Tax=Planctomonas sp. JC2975 TaxID=2729626 RepID=UPI0014739142|nr:MFS transporter [Planctomonas sp. JC2975]NNC12520.1 MFS transporter [Planctomonas sp. JC2975]